MDILNIFFFCSAVTKIKFTILIENSAPFFQLYLLNHKAFLAFSDEIGNADYWIIQFELLMEEAGCYMSTLFRYG